MAREVTKKNRLGRSIQGGGYCWLLTGEGSPTEGDPSQIRLLNDTNAPIGSEYVDLITGAKYVKKDLTPDAAGAYKVGEWVKISGEDSSNQISVEDLFYVERDVNGDIVKTGSIYDLKVPPESIEVGESIKISDLGQSLSYSTKFDNKQYILVGQEITYSGSQRPFVRELLPPSSFEIQPLSDEIQTFNSQASFPVVSFQNVIGDVYRLKAFTQSPTFRIRLIRDSSNGGEDTLIVDEIIESNKTKIDGFDFHLKPITDFTINTNYTLILSVEEGYSFDVEGSSQVSGSFLPYIKRQVGWEYVKKDLAYLEDILSYIPESDKGAPNGVAPLNSEGKIDPNYLYDIDVDGGLEIVGYWDAETNTPDLSSLTLERGQAYQVSVAGDTSLNGYDTWNEFDLAIWGDNITGNWIRIVSTEKVLSVNGEKGEVVVDKDSVGLSNVDNTADIDKELSSSSIEALALKADKGSNVSGFNNDAGYITEEDISNIVDGEPSVFKSKILSGVALTSSTSFRFEEIDCIGSIDFSEGTGWSYVENSNGIKGISVPSNGTYEISFSIGFKIPSGQRISPLVCPFINGQEKNFRSNNGYIRGTSGILEDSCILTVPIKLSANDILTIGAARSNTVASNCSTNGVGAFLSIKQISKPLLGGVSSSNDLSDFDMSTNPPQIGQIPKWNGFNFVPQDDTGGGGGDSSIEVIDKEVGIIQNSWNAETNYTYSNISVSGVEVDQLCIIYPDSQLWQIIHANGSSWEGFAYCISPNLVTAVCRVSSYIPIPNGLKFHIKTVEKISNLSSIFSESVRQEFDVHSENIGVSSEDHDKHFNILSPINYNVILPSLNDVGLSNVFKFKNLKDSSVSGNFVPILGEKIEGESIFRFHGKGKLSIRKRHSSNGDFWSIEDVSNIFDHAGQGKTTEIPIVNHLSSFEVIHNRGYRPIVKVYVEDGLGGYSEAEVDIDHDSNLNIFTVNLQGTNNGYIRYI